MDGLSPIVNRKTIMDLMDDNKDQWNVFLIRHMSVAIMAMTVFSLWPLAIPKKKLSIRHIALASHWSDRHQRIWENL